MARKALLGDFMHVNLTIDLFAEGFGIKHKLTTLYHPQARPINVGDLGHVYLYYVE